MRRLAFTILTLVVAISPERALRAQDRPTFRAGTTLIEFTFVAFDENGNPVTDLGREDLVVTEQGQPRDVVFFRFEGAPEPRTREPLPPGRFTNRFETAPNAAKHVTAIVVDGMNTAPVGETQGMTQASIRAQILRYLDTIPPNTHVALYRLGYDVKQLHAFTDDVDSLRAQVAKIDVVVPEKFATPGYRAGDSWDASSSWKASSGKRSSTTGSAEAAEARSTMLADEAMALSFHNANIRDRRLAFTLAGLEALGNHLAGIPGRKNIVWVGGGMPILTSPGNWIESHAPRMRQAAQRLATQGVAIYPVTSMLARGDKGRVLASFELFAEVTGGKVTLTMNDPTEGLRTSALDQRATYSVGFYAVGSPDNQWHPVDVRVKRPGVTVRHRQGYLSDAPAPRPLEWTEDEWRVALGDPLGSSAVRLDGQFEPAGGAERGTFDLRLRIALDDLQFREAGGKPMAEVDIVTAEKVASGDFGFRVERATLGLPANASEAPVAGYSRRLTLKPATSTIRLLVRDRLTGRYGTLDIPVR